MIIDERADTPASPEAKKDKPVRIRSDIRQPEPAADLPDETTEEKAEQVRKPVQETEALDGRAVRMCRKAVDYEVFDNFKMARRLYLAALKREPKYYRARKGLADLYFRNGYYKQALKHFRVLTTVDPENTDIIIYFGFCLYKSGNPVKAERELKKVLHLDPGNVDCMWYLSKIYKESKKIDDAVYLWVKIKNMGPRNNKWYDFADSYLNIYSSRIGPG